MSALKLFRLSGLTLILGGVLLPTRWIMRFVFDLPRSYTGTVEFLATILLGIESWQAHTLPCWTIVLWMLGGLLIVPGFVIQPILVVSGGILQAIGVVAAGAFLWMEKFQEAITR